MSILTIAAAFVLACLWQREAVDYLAYLWAERQEFSHGPLLPLLALWLAWRKRGVLATLPRDGVSSGIAVVVLGVFVVWLGDLAALMSIVHYGLALMLCGFVIAWLGVRAVPHVWLSLLLLFLAIPLPNFILNNLSLELQLLSSKIGLVLIRAFGVSVSLDGNVIDLGANKLEVAAACDGLRYLFPLITLAFVMAYFYRAAWWKRALLFVSSIPLSILMNGLRVGTIGLLVERWGPAMAQGFFHEFQGWFMFMLSAGLLLVEIMVLSRIGGSWKSWRDEFGLDSPVPMPASTSAAVFARLTPAVAGAAALVGVISLAGLLMPARVDAVPSREDFTRLSMNEGPWSGRRDRLDGVYLDALKLDDYVLADFRAEGRAQVNLYVAYYNSQRKGESAHSPRSCIPGGGWRINSITPHQLATDGGTLSVNRVVIERGDVKQVVYYWFDQRGRVLTNEYLVKWYIFWDAVTRNRTDGAMLRLTAPVLAGQSEADADRALEDFARAVVPSLRQHIPS